MWIQRAYLDSLQQRIQQLETEVEGWKRENKQLIDRLLVKNDVPPVVLSDNRTASPKIDEVVNTMDDFFKEISDEEYEKLERMAKVKPDGPA